MAKFSLPAWRSRPINTNQVEKMRNKREFFERLLKLRQLEQDQLARKGNVPIVSPCQWRGVSTIAGAADSKTTGCHNDFMQICLTICIDKLLKHANL